jgi:hypothetical protein
MVSIINISYGIKEPTGGYENCNSTQIFIFGKYFKVSVFVYVSCNLGQHHATDTRKPFD